MTEKEFYAQMLLVEPQKIRWWDRKPFQKLRSWLEDLTDILEFMVFLVLPVGLVYGALNQMVGQKTFPKAAQLAGRFDRHFGIHGLPGVAGWIGLRCALWAYNLFYTGIWIWMGTVKRYIHSQNTIKDGGMAVWQTANQGMNGK